MGKGYWQMDSSTMNKYVILAPHVDDEVIGCFRVLNLGLVTDVVYFYDLTPERIVEAQNCAKRFGFTPHFAANGELFMFSPDHIILIPNIADQHPHHKKVNQFGRSAFKQHTKQFYSVDMNVPYEILSSGMQQNKLSVLRELFPSQDSLFANDKYSFFESNLESDLITQIEVKTQFEGIHKYPNAPEEVAFLRYPHRHLFHVSVTIDVFHDDRELEFFIFQHQISDYIKVRGDTLNYRSCEMISKELLEHVMEMYPGRSIEVRVFEDGENGSVVKFNWR
jgi:hypothetical protein